jgi:hypothetical protein
MKTTGSLPRLGTEPSALKCKHSTQFVAYC